MRRVLAGLGLAIAAPAAAQDVGLPPSYGQADFTLNPPGELGHVVALEAGGNRRADSLGANCSGIIANAPDYRFQHRADGRLLRVRADAAQPIMIVVSDVLGNWHCSIGIPDDAGYRAQIDFAAPGTGIYDVWVGTMTAPLVPARLLIEQPTAP